MRIYTRKGDTGETGLLGGGRVSKDSARIEFEGTLDELNSAVGLACSLCEDPGLWVALEGIQSSLLDLGADLANVGKARESLVTEESVTELEKTIDAFDEELPLLRNFILPGGTPSAAALHFARTVCRRAERRLVTLARQETVPPVALAWLNRLSDLLFALARAANSRAGVEDVKWSRAEHGSAGAREHGRKEE